MLKKLLGALGSSVVSKRLGALVLAWCWIPAFALNSPAYGQTREITIRLFGRTAQIRLSVGALGLAIIVLLAGLLAISIFLAFLARRKMRQAQDVNRSLQDEMRARQRAEDALRQSVEEYRLLFDSNPQPMWLYDRQTERFLAVNAAATQHYGYSTEEFLSMCVGDLQPEKVPPGSVDRDDSADEAVRPAQHRLKEGRIITVEIRESRVLLAGREAGLVGVADITERKRLEEQFQQAQRLESVGRLAGGVAHDFNNLLTVITGFTEMALDELPAGDRLRDVLNEVRAAGERAAGLTQQLLAFSRKQLIRPTVLNINATIEDVHKMLRRLIGEDIDLRLKLAPDLGNIMADAGQIEQVIMNLAVNSRDAMRGGGLLALETGNLTLDDSYVDQHPGVQPGPYVMLAVTDTGSGMTPEVKERLFEPFFTTKPQGAGTGLGLATVYGIVKQAGGWIWVYSEPGRGSTFKIYLPRVDKPLPQAKAIPKTDVRGRETIVVVEDQLEVRNLATTALKRYGYEVYGASGAEDALAFAQSFDGFVHLLLTDVVMPGMSGPELARRFSAWHPGVRVLFMSGYTDDAIGHHGVLDPGVAFLQKPFTPDILAEKVRETLGPRNDLAATILVVDDEDPVRRMLRQILTSAGYGVLETGNGRQAVEQLATSPVDLVIVDLFMPEQEGLQTIQSLRAMRPGLKIIAMSGAFDETLLAAVTRLGVLATLQKPILRDGLLQIVDQMLKGEP